MTGRRIAFASVLGGALVAAGLASCQQAPPNVPLRTFERAQRVEVVCMKVRRGGEGDDAFDRIPPEPVRQEYCAPVPPGRDGTFLPYHLYALVTQTLRGEVAVVDITASTVVDTSRAIPGINFLPVGRTPTDIAATPDGALVFVASAEVNKPAIYALLSHKILGDGQGLGGEEPTLAWWPSCALPDAPVSVSVVPRAAARPTDAGGAPEGGAAEAGAPGPVTGTDGSEYDVVVVLAGTAGRPGKVVTLDAAPFRRGGGLVASPTDGPTVPPGSLVPCRSTSAIELAGGEAMPRTFAPGGPWDDGLPYSKGSWKPPSPIDRGLCPGASGGVGSELPLPIPEGAPGRPGAAVREGRLLYVADLDMPIIHVIDLGTTPIRERPPLLLTSLADPSRVVTARALAVSPPTSDRRRFLYAVDKKDGSLVVFDVTDPDLSPRVPLTRPSAKANPFQPVDRIVFNAPVATVAFTRYDWPRTESSGGPSADLTGLLCNPGDDPAATKDPGHAYAGIDRAGSAPRGPSGAPLDPVGPGLSPLRLRGIFAFATLTNGQMVTIDVDDWDAACRRPRSLVEPASELTPPQPNHPNDVASPRELVFGYPEAPHATDEVYFPVSAPHRARSVGFLKVDPSGANRVPRLDAVPQLLFDNATLSTFGDGADANPLLLPTGGPHGLAPYTISADAPAGPVAAVRFSVEAPDVHANQEWSVVFEGALPTIPKGALAVSMDSDDGYGSLLLRQPRAGFCARGIEDARIGARRARGVRTALGALSAEALPGGVPAAFERIDRRVTDYVQITDDLLPPGDDYWQEDRSCWDAVTSTPESRYKACQIAFGGPSDGKLERDLPILEASDDALRVTRYFTGRCTAPASSCKARDAACQDGRECCQGSCVAGRCAGTCSGGGSSCGAHGDCCSNECKPEAQSVATREIVGVEPTNASALRLARCCFHDQVKIQVRTGGAWLATGSVSGLLRRVKRGSDGSCVLSCDARDDLLESRFITLPRTAAPPDATSKDAKGSQRSALVQKLIARESPLAFRNPLFSFLIFGGVTDGAYAAPRRDLVWRFATRGEFTPLTISLAASGPAVAPQSMRFIDSLGQLAVVDGAAQGLVLIDLRSVGLARAPFF